MISLQTREIEFIQEFLKLQSEELVSPLENILKKEKLYSREQSFEPMSQDELYKRIDKSESDFRNNRYKSSSEILAKYDK